MPPTVTSEEWPGDIDELRVYNRVITDQPLVPDDPSTRELWKMVTRPYQSQALYSLHTPGDFMPLTGTDVPDNTDNAPSATLHGDPAQVWTAFSFRDFTPAAHLNGTTDHIAASGPAIRTDQAFTVAATVQAPAFDRSTDPGRWGTFLSQDGESNSGFSLQYAVKEDGLPYWALTVRESDAEGATVHRVYSRFRAQPGDRTEIAGGYDPIDRKITLWVNGSNQGSVTLDRPLSWNAGGPVQIGRAKREHPGLPVRLFLRFAGLKLPQGSLLRGEEGELSDRISTTHYADTIVTDGPPHDPWYQAIVETETTLTERKMRKIVTYAMAAALQTDGKPVYAMVITPDPKADRYDHPYTTSTFPGSRRPGWREFPTTMTLRVTLRTVCDCPRRRIDVSWRQWWPR